MDNVFFDEAKVTPGLFADRQETIPRSVREYPTVFWDPGSIRKWVSGYWFIRQQDFGLMPDTFSDEAIIRTGTYPYTSYEQIRWTRRLRCVLIGVRRRVVVDDLCHDYFSSYVSPKHGITAHTQAMIVLADLDKPAVIDLRGLCRSICWSTVYDGTDQIDGLFSGVEQQLEDFTHRMSAENNATIPTLCTWWMDLVPAYVDRQPHFTEIINHDLYARFNPFTVDLSINTANRDSTRFVGTAEFLRFQDIRKTLALGWEDEWNSEDSIPQMLYPLMEANYDAQVGHLDCEPIGYDALRAILSKDLRRPSSDTFESSNITREKESSPELEDSSDEIYF